MHTTVLYFFYSSMSSSMSSLSAVTWTDLLEPNMPKMSESRKTFITKLLGRPSCFLISNGLVLSDYLLMY